MARKMTLSSLLLVSCAISSLAFAHTTIKDQMIEGHTLYTADTISHGCEHGDKPMLPVIAQSIVFPNGSDLIATRADNPNEPIDLADVLVGGKHARGLINPVAIQSNDVFPRMKVLTDESGVVRSIHHLPPNPPPYLDPPHTKGLLPGNATVTGVIPFKVSGITFKPESCATKVQARIAIADWCHHRAGMRRANYWMGHTTPVFNDPDMVSKDFWPTLVINRDLTTNPLPGSCGEGYEVAIAPSDAAIDQYLPIPGFIP